jgi:predicted DCC family thiol-disulfide oxidoreductase YuxK
MTTTITRERPQVRGLTVLYDQECPVCRGARRWLEMHRRLVPVDFVPVGSQQAIARFPLLDQAQCRSAVTVVTDTGHVYRGDDAWVMCLWAVRSTRHLALQLAAGRHGLLLRAMVNSTGFVRGLTTGRDCVDQCGLLPPPPLQP